MSILFRNWKTRKRPPRLPARQELSKQNPDIPPRHIETFEFVQAFTMTSLERVCALCEAVEYICKSDIEGDMVECGVWKGGSMMAVARTLRQLNKPDRKLWLFDTFGGMSAPADCDVDFQGRQANQLLSLADPEDSQSIWCRSQLEEVAANLRSTGYPSTNVEFIPGEVEMTLLDLANIPAQISLLRLDTDWYESTRMELEHLFPRLVTGGVLIVDDYGHWEGCRKAVDEYFAENNIRVFLHRIDYTGRIGIKDGSNRSRVKYHVA